MSAMSPQSSGLSDIMKSRPTSAAGNINTEMFSGKPSEDIGYLDSFQQLDLRANPNCQYVLRPKLEGTSLAWFQAPYGTGKLLKALKDQFGNFHQKWILEHEFYDRNMTPEESLETYIDYVRDSAKAKY